MFTVQVASRLANAAAQGYGMWIRVWAKALIPLRGVADASRKNLHAKQQVISVWTARVVVK